MIRRTIVALCALSLSSYAQDTDTVYTLTVFAGGGYSRNLSPFEKLPGVEVTPVKNGLGGFVRVMWTPEHLLSVGLETGVVQVYRVHADKVQTPFGSTDFSSALNVVPLSLTFSMHLSERVEGYISSTSYLLFSQTRSFGNTVNGSMLSIGFSAGVAYMWPVDEDWNAGGELKWHHIEKSKDDNAMVQVVVSYRLLAW